MFRHHGKFWCVEFVEAILAGGTNMGRVAMWHYRGGKNKRQSERQLQQSVWELLAPCDVGYNASDLQVCMLFVTVCALSNLIVPCFALFS